MIKECIECQKEYAPNKNLSTKDRQGSKFCGYQCYWKYRKDHKMLPPSQKGKIPWNKGEKLTIVCTKCQKDFRVSPCRSKTAKYCSQKCTTIAKTQRVVSLELRKQISKKLKGANSYLWKGGITPLNESIRSSFEYKEWAKQVKHRDHYTCQLCGDNQGGNLHSNHIKKFSDYPTLRFEIINGITLCKDCHIYIVTNHEIEWESYFNFILEKQSFFLEGGV